MKLTIESTDMITTVNGAPARVWRGVTERGAHCFVFVGMLAVGRDQDQSAFERELVETDAPAELRAIDLRLIL